MDISPIGDAAYVGDITAYAAFFRNTDDFELALALGILHDVAEARSRSLGGRKYWVGSAERIQENYPYIFGTKERVVKVYRKLTDLGLAEHRVTPRSDSDDHNWRVHANAYKDEYTPPKETEEDIERDDEDPNKWGDDDWQYKYSVRWWDIMESKDRLSKVDHQNKEKRIQQWCESFDWCVRVRELSRNEVDLVLWWPSGLGKEPLWHQRNSNRRTSATSGAFSNSSVKQRSMLKTRRVIMVKKTYPKTARPFFSGSMNST